MRYIKKFNESSNINVKEIALNLEDILLELSDEGFQTNCNYLRGSKNSSFEIRVYYPKDISTLAATRRHKWDQIKDVMDRIYIYLSGISKTIQLSFYDEKTDDDKIYELTATTLSSKFREYFTEAINGINPITGGNDGFIIYFDVLNDQSIGDGNLFRDGNIHLGDINN